MNIIIIIIIIIKGLVRQLGTVAGFPATLSVLAVNGWDQSRVSKCHPSRLISREIVHVVAVPGQPLFGISIKVSSIVWIGLERVSLEFEERSSLSTSSSACATDCIHRRCVLYPLQPCIYHVRACAHVPCNPDSQCLH